MEWNRQLTIGLAKPACAFCHGYGLRLDLRGKETPCFCVFRAIFRACYGRFRDCIFEERHMSTVSLEFCSKTQGRRTYSRKTEEYIADFCIIARRTLTDEEHRIFRFHFLLGADWRLCCRRLQMDRGSFFHSIYRIQQALGRVFAELEPYGLYPVDEYFGNSINKNFMAEVVEQSRKSQKQRGRKWEVPLARPA
jgi:hypothetical protein